MPEQHHPLELRHGRIVEAQPIAVTLDLHVFLAQPLGRLSDAVDLHPCRGADDGSVEGVAPIKRIAARREVELH